MHGAHGRALNGSVMIAVQFKFTLGQKSNYKAYKCNRLRDWLSIRRYW